MIYDRVDRRSCRGANEKTAGRPIGEITDDFRQVNATWNGDDGSLGDLELRAVSQPDAADDPEDTSHDGKL